MLLVNALELDKLAITFSVDCALMMLCHSHCCRLIGKYPLRGVLRLSEAGVTRQNGVFTHLLSFVVDDGQSLHSSRAPYPYSTETRLGFVISLSLLGAEAYNGKG